MDEVEQLRADLFELYAVMNTLIEDERGRALVEACEEAIHARLDRLDELRGTPR